MRLRISLLHNSGVHCGCITGFEDGGARYAPTFMYSFLSEVPKSLSGCGNCPIG